LRVSEIIIKNNKIKKKNHPNGRRFLSKSKKYRVP
jgi:hypothetical protein